MVEQSIHDAYIQTITKSQHYIYIENQFFISLDFATPGVKNQIADTLFKRIVRAYKSVYRKLGYLKTCLQTVYESSFTVLQRT